MLNETCMNQLSKVIIIAIQIHFVYIRGNCAFSLKFQIILLLLPLEKQNKITYWWCVVILLPCLHQYCGTTACLDLPSCLPAMCTTESRSRPPFPHAVAVLPPIPAAGESYLSLAPSWSRETVVHFQYV